ncbi:MAG: hypothetical protein M3014_04590 [Chloroflexota bacterium]|nr:hypothetical protein [Chloroflexota bacterium]
MSLSDYIRYMRALKGGATPWEIAEGSGLSPGEIHLLEVKHKRVGEEDEQLEKLARFFGVPLAELARRREAYRKRLSYFLHSSALASAQVTLKLETEETLSGTVVWYTREAVALDTEPGHHPHIVQRSWVADWKEQAREEWEVEGSSHELPAS